MSNLLHCTSLPGAGRGRRRTWLVLALAAAFAPAFGGVARAAQSEKLYNGTMPGNTDGGPGDRDGLKNDEVSQCISPAGGRGVITGWLAGGTPSGYRFDNTTWGGSPKICADGQVRVQRLPSIKVNVGGQVREMYFQRGGTGSAPFGATRDNAIRQAHIWVADLSRRPSVFKISRRPIFPNGRPCPSVIGTSTTSPQPIPGYYKSLAQVRQQRKTSNEGADWGNYGDPAATEGSQRSTASFNYMLWNWRWDNNSGGGQVRATLGAGTTIGRCDVEAISSRIYGKRSNKVVGKVRGVYGVFLDAVGAPQYGWLVESYKLNGKPRVQLLT